MEQALVFASILLGIAVSDQVVSLNRLLRARHRVRWDGLLLWLAALVLLVSVQIWWNLARHGTGPLTIGQFLPTLVGLILIALLAFAVLPDDVPDDGIDLRTYYHEQSGYLWTLFVLAFGWTLLSQDVAALGRGVPWQAVVFGQWEDLVFLLLTASLVVVRRRWWHMLVLALLSLGPLGWLGRSVG